MKGCLVYLWSIMLACWSTMEATYRRGCNRCLTWVHVLGWCWLSCRNNHLCHLCIMSWSSGNHLHKHCTSGISHSTYEHTCIIQARRRMKWDPSRRRPRSRNFWEDQSREKSCKSAQTTSRACLRKASPGAF